MSSTAIPATESVDRFTWRGIFASALAHRRELVLAHLIAIAAVTLSVPVPLLMPLLVDEVLLQQPAQLVGFMNRIFPADWHGPVLYIGVMLIVTASLRFSSVMLNVLQTRQFSLIGKDVVFRIRRNLLQRLRRISMAEYESLGTGSVTSHFVTDLNAIDDFIGLSVSKFVVAVLSLIGTSIVLLWMHWQLALFILLLNPVVVYFTVQLGKRVKHLKRRENRAFELFQEALAETLDGIQQIRAANREQHYLQRVVDRARLIRTDSAAYSWKSDAATRLSFFVFLTGFDTFRAVSMLMVVFSDLSVGQMMAVFAYLWFMMTPVQDVLGIQYAYFGAKAALERINRLMALQQEPQFPASQNPFAGKRGVSIDLDHIHFTYRDNEPVLNDLSLHIAAGERIALVGASGGGKSTLVQVLLGLYQASRGEYRVAGVPIEQIGYDVMRDHVATVLQHPVLFNDTVRSNLTLGREEIDDTLLWQVLDQAQLAEVVREMPQGLETTLGKSGVKLSGGQRQRLAIARLLLTDPQLVILDEATSALDLETEAALYQAIEPFLAGRSVIIVAHRLSAVKLADRAYVFEGGQIAEQGTHHELVASGGLYSRLYG